MRQVVVASSTWDLDAMERPDDGEWLRWNQIRTQINGTMTTMVVCGSAAVLRAAGALSLRDRQRSHVISAPGLSSKLRKNDARQCHDAARR